MLRAIVRQLLFLLRVGADLRAIQRGRIMPRLYNRAVGHLGRRTMNRLWWR